MNREAQRIAIAKACGWYPNGHVSWIHAVHGHKTGRDATSALPDYLNDLNAMHEAEKKLSREDFFKYCDELSHVLDRVHLRGEPLNGYDAWRIHTPAIHRAEAFLRTLNLWTLTP